MESSFQFMRRYWNPAAVLDALDIKAWPPSVDEVEDYYEGQHRSAPELPRWDPPSFAHMTAAAAAAFGRPRDRQKPSRTTPAPEQPRGEAPSFAHRSRPATPTATASGAAAADVSAFSLPRDRQQPSSPAPTPPRRPWLSPRDAALRIQGAYRGHRVRESVRRVSQLEGEVDAVEARIMASLDQILEDDRERARVNGMIMGVIVRLDGVEGGCREYRKSVVAKAISLQEALDHLAGGEGRGCDGGNRGTVPTQQKQQLGREETNRGIWGEEGEGSDDDQAEGNNSGHEDDDDEEEQEESERGVVKEALDRVLEENKRLLGLVDQQSRLVSQLTKRVKYLERKIQRLGRKRRRSKHGSGSCGAPSCSSSSAGEGNDSDRDEGGGDDHMMGGHDLDRRDCDRLLQDGRQQGGN